MKLFRKIKEKIAEYKAKKLFKKIEIDPKGVCLAIYSAKIACGVLPKEEIMTPYETDLYQYFLVSYGIEERRVWTPEERIMTAAAYLTFTFNCSNGEYVQKRVFEEIEEYL